MGQLRYTSTLSVPDEPSIEPDVITNEFDEPAYTATEIVNFLLPAIRDEHGVIEWPWPFFRRVVFERVQ
jgi:hypothetical protein